MIGLSGSVLSTVMFVPATTLSSFVFSADCVAEEIGRLSIVQSFVALLAETSENNSLSDQSGVPSGICVGKILSAIVK